MSESDKPKENFDLHFKYLEDLRNLYAKYDARTSISINCLNFSVAIWAVITTVLFDVRILPFICVLIYLILSIILMTIAVIGWLKGFSVLKFKKFKIFDLNPDADKIDKTYYEDNTKKMSGHIQKHEITLATRELKVNYLSRLSIIALFISVFLALFVLVGKVSENYDFKIKPQICAGECNNNFNNTGVLKESNETEKESERQID